MNTSRQHKIFIASLLACSVFGSMSLARAATEVPATTTWQIGRVASVSQGSYCTMAQKFADNTVLTFAQNGREEYSLAIEMPKQEFEAGKEQSVTLRAQGGAAQTYKAKNESAQAVVVGIGKDALLIGQLNKTERMNVDIAGSKATYVFGNYGQGRADMAKCLQALRTNAAPAADMAKSERTGISSPDAQVARQIAHIEASSGVPEPSAEGLLAAKPSPMSGAESLGSSEAVPVKTVTQEKVSTLAEAPVKAPAAEDSKNNERELALQSLQDENARLKRSLNEARKSYEDQQAALSGPAINEIKAKLDSAIAENKELQDKISNLEKSADASKNVQAKDENVLAAEIQRARQDIQTLKAENETLRNQAKVASDLAGKSKEGAATQDDKLASLTQENQSLKLQIESLKQAPKANEGEVQKQIGALQKKLFELQDENANLQKQVASRAEPAANAEGEDKLREELRELRSQVATLQTEKGTLQASLEKMQKDGETSQLKVAGGNWDLEQATRRYQESQREIRRLGAMLEANNLKCQQEKKDIEYMLFDPEIAKGAQISMLNNLEDQLAEKDKVIQDLQAGASAASPEQEQQLASLQQQVASLQGQLKAKADENGAEFARKESVIAELQSKLSAVQKNQQASVSQQAALAGLNDQLSKSGQKIASLEAELAETKARADAASKQMEIAAQNAAAIKEAKMAQDAQLAQATKLATEAQTAQSQTAEALKAAQAQAAEALKVAQDIRNKAAAEAKEAQLLQQAQAARLAQLATSAGTEAAKPVPVSTGYQSIAYATPPAAKPASRFLSLNDMDGVLKSAGVSTVGAVQNLSGGNSDAYRAYSWKTSSLYGSVEMRKISGKSAVDDVIGQYLARAKSRCQGDFAAVPSTIQGSSKGYEIACVSPKGGSSASVLFTYRDGVAMTIAHEGRAEAMDLAIEARDKVASQLIN